MWAQKYGYLPNYTTLLEKKVSFLSVQALFLGLTVLPLWCLATPPTENKLLALAAQPVPGELLRADSLFAQARYAAAAPAYRRLVWQQRLASPTLLLKMAYIQEQLGQYPAALVYLTLAQARQPRVSTWRQLTALATRHRLTGYPDTWQQELRVQAQRYYYLGLQVLLAAALVGAVWLLWRRAGRGAWLGYALYVAGLGAYLHLLRPLPVGLVARPGAALMAGPAAGAAWLSTAAVGDRLPVLGRQDIWCRVQWQQREAFVRATDVLVIE